MISKQAYVDPTAKLGNNVEVMPFAFIGEDVEIGDNCIIMPYAGVLKGTTIGKNNRIHGHALLGVDPQDFKYHGEASRLIVGDNNDIRENVVIARGTHADGATKIGNGNHIMEKVHICHDADIHDNTVLGILKTKPFFPILWFFTKETELDDFHLSKAGAEFKKTFLRILSQVVIPLFTTV